MRFQKGGSPSEKVNDFFQKVVHFLKKVVHFFPQGDLSGKMAKSAVGYFCLAVQDKSQQRLKNGGAVQDKSQQKLRDMGCGASSATFFPILKKIVYGL